MKKIASLLILAVSLFSCSNDSSENYSLEHGIESNSIIDDSVITISSFEEWINLNDFEPTINAPLIESDSSASFIMNHTARPKTRLVEEDDYYKEYTVKGYDNLTKSATQRVMFSQDMASILGLYTGRIYHVHTRTLDKKVKGIVGQTFWSQKSPKCGYTPINGGINFNTRGYAGYLESETVVNMYTFIFFVEADEWSVTINREYPCASSQVEWVYGIEID